VTCKWSEVDGYGYCLCHKDSEYLHTKMRNELEKPENEWLRNLARPSDINRLAN
jgi:hypothetical protein